MSNETWRLVYAHVVLIIGVIFMSFPVWVAFATSTHDSVTILTMACSSGRARISLKPIAKCCSSKAA